MTINTGAGYGVERGILLLACSKRRLLPIGKSLILGDSFAKKNAIDACQRIVCDTKLLDELLHIYKSFRIEFSHLVEIKKIIVNRSPNLQNLGIFKQSAQFSTETNIVEAKKEATVVARKLH